MPGTANNHYLIDLQRTSASANIGNKARNLHTLMRLGRRVPPTLVCTWDAYQRYRHDDAALIEGLRAELAGRLDQQAAYAVRSSANFEDGFEHSFAGQFKSVLNVCGPDAVLQAMWSIWATATSPGVTTYLTRLGRDARDLQMGVIIQQMVTPVVSGVAFSRNPMTGLDEIVVEAVRGQGDQLVQAGLTPHRWINKWGEWIAQPDRVDIQLALVGEVVAQTKAIARAYGRPIDLEWVYDGQHIYWVQLREITSLNNLHLYSNRISREVMPGLIKPLIWSINVPLVNGAWVKLFTELIGPNSIDPLSLSKQFYYRSYFNMTAVGDVMTALGMPRDTLELMLGIPSAGTEKPRFKPTARTYRLMPRLLRAAADKWTIGPRVEAFVPHMRAQFRAFQWQRASDLTPAQLLAEIDRLYPLVQQTAYYNIVVPLLMQAYNRMLQRQLKKRGVDFAAFDLTRGLAELAEYDPNPQLGALRQAYQRLSEDDRARWHAAEPPPELRAFIEQFGHLSDNGNDFSATPWREQPELVAQLLAQPQLAESGAARKLGFDDLPLSPLARRVMRLWYERARRFRLYREAISSLYTLGYGLFRPYYRELGRRFEQAGLIPARDDVFFMTAAEVRAAAAGQPPADLRALLARRRQELDECRQLTPPDIIYGDQPLPLDAQAGRQLRGVPTSRGYYQGPARVVRGLRDFGKVQPGDVLIIPYSDVGWTPLFVGAGAIVAESGGMLSHSSIVAREYNLPAVVSVTGACDLADETLVTVDGYKGIVTIHAV